MRIHSTFQDGGAGAKLALDRLDASAKDCAAAVQGSGCRSRGGNIKMQAVAAGAATMSVAQACAFMQDPSLSGMTVEPHGQSAPLAVLQLGSCASSGRAWWLRAARHSQGEAQPLGAPPLPRVLESAASKAPPICTPLTHACNLNPP
eukprot:scaffold21024_cov55-Phaeocystis_antarctica.AAC.5